MPISPKQTASGNPQARHASVWDTDISELFGRSSQRYASKRALSVFCRKAAALLSTGVPVKSIMPTLAENASERRLEVALQDVHKEVMQGDSFSGCLERTGVFPPLLCKYVKVGEQTAQLPKVCSQLADYYQQQAKTDRELASALIYPAFVAALMVTVIAVTLVWILPSYAQIFARSGVPLPALTSMIFGVSDFLMDFGSVIAAGMLALLGAAVIFLRKNTGQNFLARIKLRIPLFRKGINFRFLQVISLLLSSGLSLSEALPFCVDVMDNPIVKEDLQKLSNNVNKGVAFWEAVKDIRYFDPMLTEMARSGEAAGVLPSVMETCLGFFEDEYNHSVSKVNKLITPIMTMILGVVLVIVIISVVLPTFELTLVL